jgi:branched-subunit amino acid ABC-type transport system permease component
VVATALSEVSLQLLNGLFVGLSLALVAAGLALVFGVLRIVNFAQGELVMLGAYAVVLLDERTHNFALSVTLATLTVGLAGGLLLFLMLRPLHGKSPVLPMLATLGLSLILRQLAVSLFGGFIRTVDEPIHVGVPVHGLQYPVYDLLIAVVSAAALTAGYLFLRRARFGIWLRAAVDNSTMAAALGVPLPRVYLVAFIASAGLSALAGAMLAPVTAVYATLGQDVAFNAFVVVIAGGMGNFRGAALIAILLGEIQAVGSIWFRPVAVQVFAIGLVIVVLVVRSRRRPDYSAPASVSTTTAAPAWLAPALACVFALLALTPLLLGPAAVQQAMGVLMYALLASAVAILLRFGGVVNVGMGAAFGASAYAVAVLSHVDQSTALLLFAAGLVAAATVGLLFGLYASVASGVEYMMLTFLTTAAASRLPILIPALSGGANGLDVRNVAGFAFGFDPLFGPGFYVLGLAVSAACLGVVWRVLGSQAGRVAQAASRNPLRMASLGYSLGALRLLVALSAGLLAGLAGWLYSLQSRLVGADVLGLDVSLNGLMYALVGGVQQPILGSVLGTSIVRLLGALTPRTGPPASFAAGVGLLAVVYVLPDGILGLRFLHPKVLRDLFPWRAPHPYATSELHRGDRDGHRPESHGRRQQPAPAPGHDLDHQSRSRHRP